MQAKDPSALIDSIEIGEPPACRQGNSPSIEAYLMLSNTNRDSYDGPISYRGVDPQRDPPVLLFDVPGPIELGFETAPLLELRVTPGTLRQLAIGEQLWLNSPSPYLQVNTPFDAATTALVEETLGVTLAAEKNCDYIAGGGTRAPVALWDVVFDTTPRVRAKSGESAKVTLDGHDYSVWLWGENEVRLVVSAS